MKDATAPNTVGANKRAADTGDLRARLQEAEETLRAIRSGEVDALVVEGPEGEQIYTLRSADTPYRILVEGMSEGAITLNEGGLILYSNHRFASIVDMPHEKVTGSSIFDYVRAENRPDVETVIRNAGHEGAAQALETTLLKGDGSVEVPVYLAASILPSEGMRIICLVATDLTEQKRNQEIVAAEKLTRSILDQAVEAVIVCDPDGRIIRANQAAYRLCGNDPTGDLFDRAFPLRLERDPESALELPVKVASHHNVIKGVEVRYRRGDGVLFHLLASAGPLTGSQRETLGCVVALADITSLKQMEMALLESERQYRTLMEQASDSILLAGPDGFYVDVNAKACEMFGYTREEMLNLRPEDLFAPEELAGAPIPWEALRSGQVFHLERKLRRKDGTTFHAETSARMLNDGRFLSITRDSTERKLAEEERARLLEGEQEARKAAQAALEALRKSEARFMRLAESRVMGIIVADVKGNITEANDAFLEMIGYTRQDLESGAIRWLDLTPPEYEPLDKHAVDELLSRGACAPFEKEYVHKDGHRVPVLLGAALLDTAEPTSISFVLDISGRKRAEKERATLLASERAARAEAEDARRHFAFLAEASSILSSSLDYEVTLATVANLAVALFGDYCIVDILQPDSTIRKVAAASADPTKAALLEELRQHPPTLSRPHPVTEVIHTGRTVLVPSMPAHMREQKDSDPVYVDLITRLGFQASLIVPLRGRGQTFGAITFVGTNARDLSDPAYVAFAEELARRASIAVDNARLYREAQEAVRSRDELLSIVSHDLKNPLSAVKGFAQVLQRRVQKMDPADAARLTDGLEQIDNVATRMNQLLDELLDFARLQAGQPLELRLQPTDLVALARKMVSEYRQGSTNHAVIVETTRDEINGLWDAHRLERLLGNLLSNAIKYSPSGGAVVVSLDEEEGKQGERIAVINVTDQGIGIPESDLPYIFDWYKRAGNVSSSVSGTGLGLAIARQIAEQQGGSISVQSQEGEGSTFTVRLPLDPLNHPG